MWLEVVAAARVVVGGWCGCRDQMSLLSLFRLARIQMSVKDSSYVLWCDARISPCGSDGQAYLVFGGMSCAYV